MNKFLTLTLTFLFIFAASSEAQSRKERKALFGSSYNYEVTTLVVGQDGTKVLKVWSHAKKVDAAIVQAKKDAVAACLFRGITGAGGNYPPICSDPNAEMNNLDYFNDFFKTAGPYLQYVNLTTDGVPSGQDRLKIKGGYKVGVAVQVMYDNLRKKMEADGITKGLDSYF